MVGLLVILFVVVALFALFPPSSRKVEELLFWLFGSCLFVLAAFRLEAQSPDYDAYLVMYEDYARILVEPSFVAISWFVKTVFDHSLFLFIIYALLAVFIKLKAIKDFSPPTAMLALLTYMSMVYIVQEHAQMRAGVATAFFLLTIKPLYERNWKRYFLFTLCAILFHMSALILLPLWFVVWPKANKYFLFGLIPVGYLLYFSGINLLTLAVPIDYVRLKLEVYQAVQEAGKDGFDYINVFGFGVLLKCLCFYLLALYREVIRKHVPYIDVLLILYAIGIFFIPAFATMPVVSFRLSAILVSIEILLFPMFYYIFKPKLVGRMVVVLISALNFYLSLQILA